MNMEATAAVVFVADVCRLLSATWKYFMTRSVTNALPSTRSQVQDTSPIRTYLAVGHKCQGDIQSTR